MTLLGRVDEEGLIREYSVRSSFLRPPQEDYGFVTVEAFKSRKAVITTDDSGGAQELVGKSGAGIVTPPDPGKRRRLWTDLLHPLGAGEAGGDRPPMGRENLSWERAVKVLVS